MHILRWPLVVVSLMILAAGARSADPTPTDADFAEQVRKLDAKNTKEEEPPQKSKVCLQLEKQKVEEKLRKLREDPDRGVRDAVTSALEKLAALQEKKP